MILKKRVNIDYLKTLGNPDENPEFAEFIKITIVGMEPLSGNPL